MVKDYTLFQQWLRNELDSRNMSMRQLETETGIARSSISRWLMPLDDPRAVWPSYESLQILARRFGVDFGRLLELAGREDQAPILPGDKRDAVALLRLMPDDRMPFVLDFLRSQVSEDILRRAANAPKRLPVNDEAEL